MNFCCHCGQPVEQRIPEGDNLPRHVCIACKSIHYQNPKIVAGCIPEWEGKILLCRRAINPRYGLWTLPAGFMENGETTQQAALRETWEEARAEMDIQSLYAVFSIPHISQVYMLFRGPMRHTDFSAGPESLEVKLFSEKEIPWDELAFNVVGATLKQYYQDLSQGSVSQTHVGDILQPTNRSI